MAYELVGADQRNKLQPKTYKRILVGYDSESSNYRLLDWMTKRITVSRHVRFDESSSPLGVSQGKKWPTEIMNDNKEQMAHKPHESILSDEDKQERQLRDRSSLRAPVFY